MWIGQLHHIDAEPRKVIASGRGFFHDFLRHEFSPIKWKRLPRRRPVIVNGTMSWFFLSWLLLVLVLILVLMFLKTLEETLNSQFYRILRNWQDHPLR